MTWVSIWPGHLIGSLSFVNGNKTPSCLQSLLWVFVSLCVWYSMFSSSGLLAHINLYQLHFVLYLHHFLPTYCVILPQECCLLLKVVRRTWNNHLHVIQHDSSRKRAEVCCATPTKTRAAWPSSDRSVRPRCPLWTLSSIGVATEWYGSWWDSNGRGGWVLVFRPNLETWGPNHTSLATQNPLTSSGCISISGTSRTGGISGCSEIVWQLVCSLYIVVIAQRLAWIICLFLCNKTSISLYDIDIIYIYFICIYICICQECIWCVNAGTCIWYIYTYIHIYICTYTCCKNW